MYWYHQASEREELAGYPPPPSLFEPAYQFVEATGLRRSELTNLLVRDIHRDDEGRLWIHVAKSRRRAIREVPVLAEHEQVISIAIQNARLFLDLPSNLDVQYERKQYALHLYAQLLRTAPPPHGSGETNVEAVRAVMQALGHSDQAVVTRYYLGLREDPESPMATESTNTEQGLADQQQ
jgi:integrase